MGSGRWGPGLGLSPGNQDDKTDQLSPGSPVSVPTQAAGGRRLPEDHGTWALPAPRFPCLCPSSSAHFSHLGVFKNTKAQVTSQAS